MTNEYTITEDILFTNFIRSKPNISEKTKRHYKPAIQNTIVQDKLQT